jgi:TonB family protein
MLLATVFTLAIASSEPSAPSLVGLWESKARQGGIGQIFEFHSDGTFVSGLVVVVDMPYRVESNQLVIGGEASGPGARSGPSSFRFEGEALLEIASDGSVVRKERISPKDARSATIVGDWRYCHYAGAMAYERYTDDGQLRLRIPVKTSSGRYAFADGVVTMSGGQPPVPQMKVQIEGEKLVQSGPHGETAEYARAGTTAWYGLENVPCASSLQPSQPAATQGTGAHAIPAEPSSCETVDPPHVVRRYDPDYPGALRKQGIQGTVVMKGTVSAAGKVENIEVKSSPDPRLSELAVEAFRRWKYEPAHCADEPVAVYVTVTTRFSVP